MNPEGHKKSYGFVLDCDLRQQRDVPCHRFRNEGSGGANAKCGGGKIVRIVGVELLQHSSPIWVNLIVLVIPCSETESTL